MIKVISFLKLIVFTAVAITFFSFSADNISLNELQRNFDQFFSKYPASKLNFQFNQPSYAPGDTVFYHMLYRRPDGNLMPGSYYVNVRLYKNQKQVVATAKVKITDGSVSNQLTLPDSLQAGYYLWVAYTDYMLNFGESQVYQRFVKVERKNQVIGYSSSHFLPEVSVAGGYLVAGLTNDLLISGKPKEKAQIILSGHDTTTLYFDSLGFIHTNITPRMADSVVVLATGHLKTTKTILPVSEFGAKIRHTPENPYKISVEFPSNENSLTNEFLLVVLVEGEIIQKQKVESKKGLLQNFEIPKTQISTRLHHVYLLTESGDPVSELHFINESDDLIKPKIEIPLTTPQRTPTPGKIQITDQYGRKKESAMHIRAFPMELFGSYEPMPEWLEAFPSLQLITDNYSKISTSEWNTFLAHKQWPQINWRSINKEKTQTINYALKDKLNLRGTVFNIENGSLAPDSTRIIGYLQSNNEGYEAYTKNGKFALPFIFDIFESDQIYLSVSTPNGLILDKNYSVKVEVPSPDISIAWVSEEIQKESAYGKLALTRQKAFSSFSFFSDKEKVLTNTSETLNEKIKNKIGSPDINIDLKKYVIFPTMKDIIIEILPFVNYKEGKSGPEIRMLLRLNELNKISADCPLFIIDGVMMRDTELFLSITPEDILTIEVYNNPNKLVRMGKLGENGVLLIKTTNKKYALEYLSRQHTSVNGLTRAKPYLTGTLSNKVRFPDLRSGIVWSPAVLTDGLGQLEFIYTPSDINGPLLIQVIGITADGEEFSTSQFSEVIFNPAIR